MKYPYRRNSHPPAPVIEVTFISAAERLQTEPLSAAVDTGADGTLVPIQYLDEIHAPATVEMPVHGPWSDSRRVMLYLVDMQIGDLFLPDMEVVGDLSGHEVVLGRDVLNHLRITLDGPKEIVSVFE